MDHLSGLDASLLHLARVFQRKLASAPVRQFVKLMQTIHVPLHDQTLPTFIDQLQGIASC